MTGSVSSVHFQRRTSRPKCVSTVMPGMPNALPSTTLAVLRPKPGSVTSSLSVCGTSPSKSLDQQRPELDQRVVLFRKKPVLWISSSSSARSAAAYAAASGYLRNSAGVTWLTPLSVLCADRMVATDSSSGVVKSSSQCASG